MKLYINTAGNALTEEFRLLSSSNPSGTLAADFTNALSPSANVSAWTVSFNSSNDFSFFSSLVNSSGVSISLCNSFYNVASGSRFTLPSPWTLFLLSISLVDGKLTSSSRDILVATPEGAPGSSPSAIIRAISAYSITVDVFRPATPNGAILSYTATVTGVAILNTAFPSYPPSSFGGVGTISFELEVDKLSASNGSGSSVASAPTRLSSPLYAINSSQPSTAAFSTNASPLELIGFKVTRPLSSTEMYYSQEYNNSISFSVTSLQPYILVNISIVATTKGGDSPLALLLNIPTLQDVPPKLSPPVLKLTANQSDVTISWSAASSSHGPILSYRVIVNCQNSSDPGIIIYEGLSLNVTLPNVTFISCNVRVSASTVVGWGPYSDSSLSLASSNVNSNSAGSGSSSSLSSSKIYGIIGGTVGAVIILALVVFIVWTRDSSPLLATRLPGGLSFDVVPDDWEFPREQLDIVSTVGHGAFGIVYRAVAKGILGTEAQVTTVAVKQPSRRIFTQEDRDAFLAELSTLKKVSCAPHKNVFPLCVYYHLLIRAKCHYDHSINR